MIIRFPFRFLSAFLIVIIVCQSAALSQQVIDLNKETPVKEDKPAEQKKVKPKDNSDQKETPKAEKPQDKAEEKPDNKPDNKPEDPLELQVVSFETDAESAKSDGATAFELPADSVIMDRLDAITFEEELSLNENGEGVAASKLFRQLLAEKEEQKKLKEKELAAAYDGKIRDKEGNIKNRPADPKQQKYKKIVTKTVTTYSTGGGSRITELPSVNAGFRASTDALKLVKLASFGDGIPLEPLWAQYMVEAGKAFGIDPVLILEVCRQESRFKNTARSGANAHGLMQFIPATASRFGIDPYNPQEAIYGGAKYLRTLLNIFGGEVRSALAGYNAGEGAVIAFKTGKTIYSGNKTINPAGRVTAFGIPPYAETQNYVATIYAKYLLSLRRLDSM